MIVTFYSFKGGVGRSFSLVETAVQLARRGRSVVVWDLDLEAPGLQRIPALRPLEDRLRAGTVDLLLELQREWEFPEKLLRDALVGLDHPRLVGTGGRLSFLLPGRLGEQARGKSYAERFASVDWSKLFDREGGTGVEFFHAVARRLTRDLGFEYVLVDARTGYTDLGILSTLYLPDLVVLLSNLNEQNLQGVADVYRRVTATPARRGNRNLRALLVVNMVPTSLPTDPPPSDEERRRFADEHQRKLAWLRETLHVEPFLELPLRPERLLLERVPSLEGLEREATEWTPLVNEIEAERRTLAGAAEADREHLPVSAPDERTLLRTYGLADLVARPVLLEMIVASLPSPERSQLGEPVSLVRLYEGYYCRWVEDPRLRLSAEIKGLLVDHLARTLWNEPVGGVPCQLLAEHLGREPPGAIAAEQIDYEMRTAVFLERQVGGDYSFIHRSFLEFFVARAIRAGLRTGNADMLNLERLTREVAFFLELSDEAKRIPEVCRAVLSAPYRPRVSENALLLLYWHAYARFAPLVGGHEERGETSGLTEELRQQWDAWGVDPHAFRLEGADLAGATIPGIPLDGALLEGADLSRALVRKGAFGRARLANVRLTFADAREAHFVAADFVRVDASHADARNANFWQADLAGADFTFAQLRGALLLESETTPATRFRAAGLLGAQQPPEFAPDAFTGRPTTDAAALALVLQYGHDHGSTHVAWSRDGLCLAVGVGGTVAIWDAAARRLVRTMAGHSDAVRTVAWDASGERVASASNDKTVKVWDAGSGRLLNTLEGHVGMVLSVAWAPHGTLLASASDDKSVRVWDGSSGRLLWTLEGHEGYVTCVAWDAAGERVASGSSDGTARTWDVERGAQLASLEHPSQRRSGQPLVQSLAWDSTGERLAVACESTVFVWDIVRGVVVQQLVGHTHFVRSVAWEPGGKRVASGSFDDTVRIWDAENGGLLRTLNGVRRRTSTVSQGLQELQAQRRVAPWDVLGIESVAWAPDGERVASGSHDGTVHVWHASTGQLSNWFQGYADRAFCVAWDPRSDRLAAGSAHQRVTIWHASNGLPQTTFEAHSEPVECLAWDPRGERLATGSTDRHVKLWDAGSGRVLKSLAGHANRVTSVVWEPSGSGLASGSDDSTVKLWDVDSGRVLRTLEGRKSVKCVSWEPGGGRRVAAASGGTVIVWDTSSGAQLLSLPDGEELIASVAWLGTDRLASASVDGTVKVWDASSGCLLRTLEGHSSRVQGLAWDAGRERLASGSADGTVKVWEASSGSLLWTLQGHRGWISSVAWDSSGERIVASCFDGGLWVWEPATNSSNPLVRLYPGGDGHALAITGDGHVAATHPQALDFVRFADRWALYDVTDVPSRVIPFAQIAKILKRR